MTPGLIQETSVPTDLILMPADNSSLSGKTSESPRVSVILTVYKRTEYLATALQSALAQSYRDFEIIVADDSGTSAAKAIVEAHSGDGRVRYLPNPETLGIARSIVGAVKIARGEFISILNDDDIWEANLLEKLVPPLIADPKRVLACADHWIMDVGGQIDQKLSEHWTQEFGRAGLKEGLVPNPLDFVVEKGGVAINLTSVFRKDAVDWTLVVLEVSGAYDYWISCLLAAARRPIYFVPQRLGRWRVHPQSETARSTQDRMVYIYPAMLKTGWFPELRSFLEGRLAETLVAVGRDKLRSHRTAEARSFFWRAFLVNRRPKALVRVAATFLPSSILTGLRTAHAHDQSKEHGSKKDPLTKMLTNQPNPAGHSQR